MYRWTQKFSLFNPLQIAYLFYSGPTISSCFVTTLSPIISALLAFIHKRIVVTWIIYGIAWIWICKQIGRRAKHTTKIIFCCRFDFLLCSLYPLALGALTFVAGKEIVIFKWKRAKFWALLFCWWLVSSAINHIRTDFNIFQFSWFKLLEVNENRFNASGKWTDVCLCGCVMCMAYVWFYMCVKHIYIIRTVAM